MQHNFAVSSEIELQAYQDFVSRHEMRLRDFIAFLKDHYAVVDFPEYMVWSNVDMATKMIRDIRVPAYTNDLRMVMTPELDVWKRIYLEQLESYDNNPLVARIRDYYQKKLTEDHLLQIIGHELTHNSDLFLDDDAYEKGIWFEEGMVEYISRCYFLTEEAYQAEKTINEQLVSLFEKQFGEVDVEAFGLKIYDDSMAAIFVHYWKSVLLIDNLVKQLGTVQAVFKAYHDWDKAGQEVCLSDWFARIIESNQD